MMKKEKKKEVVDADWTKEEVSLLAKGIARFPPGTTQRWATITDYVGSKTQKEVLKKAEQMKKKREAEIAENQAVAKAKEGNSYKPGKKVVMPGKQGAANQENTPGNWQPTDGSRPESNVGTKAAPKKEEPTTPTVDEEGWSGDQQVAMEAGMKKFPGSIPTKERWVKIAEEVEGKSAKECFTRFKSIVAKLKEQQAAK